MQSHGVSDPAMCVGLRAAARRASDARLYERILAVAWVARGEGRAPDCSAPPPPLFIGLPLGGSLSETPPRRKISTMDRVVVVPAKPPGLTRASGIGGIAPQAFPGGVSHYRLDRGSVGLPTAGALWPWNQRADPAATPPAVGPEVEAVAADLCS